MPIMEISLVPIGTRKTSISRFVASSEKVFAGKKGIRREINAMGTLVEAGSVQELFKIAHRMHKKVLASGARRVLTHITIDERLDKKGTLSGKVESVLSKLKGQGR